MESVMFILMSSGDYVSWLVFSSVKAFIVLKEI